MSVPEKWCETSFEQTARPVGAGVDPRLFAGEVVRKLTTPWRDGTTHLVMPPLEFMRPEASLAPMSA
jgi:hypothetical protein